MIVLKVDDVIRLHERVIAQSGGATGILNRAFVESACRQPFQTFGGQELYPTMTDKAACLAYSLIRNHGFCDGNKRIAHAALELTLLANGWEMSAEIDAQFLMFTNLAAGLISRDQFTEWVASHVIPCRVD